MIDTVERARDIVRFMSTYQRKNGFAPTRREIIDGTGLSSDAVSELIDFMEAQGVISRIPRVPRGTYLPNEPNQFDNALNVRKIQRELANDRVDALKYALSLLHREMAYGVGTETFDSEKVKSLNKHIYILEEMFRELSK